MENIKKNFWKYALSYSKKANQSVALKDIFLKWAATNSLKIKQAQDIWKQIQAAITFVDNGVLYQVDNPEDVKEIQRLDEPLDLTGDMPEESGIPEESDISEKMRDAIEEKKQEKQEEPKAQRTLLDDLEDDEEETSMPETMPNTQIPEVPEELPPLPAGAV